MPSVAVLGTRGYPSYYGGFETAVRKLVPYLVDAGWDILVYGRNANRGAERIEPAVTSINTWGLDSKNANTLSYGLTSALDAAWRRPDVALVMNVANGWWLPILRARGIPTLVNVDGIEWERAKWNRVGKAVFRGGATLTAKFATELVVDAQAMGDYWSRQLGRGGVFIPYGGDPVPPLPVEPGLASGRYILVVARLVPENSVGIFLDALPDLAERHDVVIVGTSGFGGELEARVQKASLDHERVHWLGHVRDEARLHALWQHAGVYFHGHTVGGTNPALVQAMACGAPTVAVDTIFNREVLDNAGIFVSPRGEEVSSEILRLVDDAPLRATLRDRAVKRAAAHYNWPDVCGRYHEALLALVSGTAAR